MQADGSPGFVGAGPKIVDTLKSLQIQVFGPLHLENDCHVELDSATLKMPPSWRARFNLGAEIFVRTRWREWRLRNHLSGAVGGGGLEEGGCGDWRNRVSVDETVKEGPTEGLRGNENVKSEWREFLDRR